MATSASKKSWMPRGCSPSWRPSSAPVRGRSPSLVNSSISTAVRRTLEFQKAKAVCRIGEESSGVFMQRSMVQLTSKRNLASIENILPGFKTVLLNADLVIEGYVDPREPLRGEDPFGDHAGFHVEKFCRPRRAWKFCGQLTQAPFTDSLCPGRLSVGLTALPGQLTPTWLQSIRSRRNSSAQLFLQNFADGFDGIPIASGGRNTELLLTAC